jgi:ABC-type glycerol-3-phosphate transport system substrate-binding protein
MRYIALIVLVLVLAACGSGNPQPSPTGAAGDADGTICTNAPIGYSQEITTTVLQNATPDLVALVTTWEGYLGQAAAMEPGAQANANDAQEKISSWCSDHGF